MTASMTGENYDPAREAQLKYMCRIDYLTTSFKGTELMRTGTIANGANMCDFRYRLAGNPKQQPIMRPVD